MKPPISNSRVNELIALFNVINQAPLGIPNKNGSGKGGRPAVRMSESVEDAGPSKEVTKPAESLITCTPKP